MTCLVLENTTQKVILIKEPKLNEQINTYEQIRQLTIRYFRTYLNALKILSTIEY